MKHLIKFNEASFENDFLKEDKAKQILQVIKDDIKERKYTEYSDGGYGMKVRDLNIMLYSPGTIGNKAGKLTGAVAQFSPEYKTLRIYDVNMVRDPKTKRVIDIELPDENSIRHELIHYLDSKKIGGKKMAERGFKNSKIIANIKAVKELLSKGKKADEISKQLKLSLDTVKSIINTKSNTAREHYYNIPEEFNAHWFEYAMPLINEYLDGKKELPSFETFRDQVYNIDGIEEFLHYLNDKYKRKFDKRLGVYYQGVRDALHGTPLKHAEPVYRSEGFLNKLKSLFTRH
jgi:hypothetical protein